MGNCIRKGSSEQWVGEEWVSPASETLFSGDKNLERETFLGNDEKGDNNSSAPTTEVKIKITKKQLEELLGKVDMQGLSIQQVLSLLIKSNVQYHETHQRSWKPSLKSIPEVN